jgi:hypothetical protein
MMMMMDDDDDDDDDDCVCWQPLFRKNPLQVLSRKALEHLEQKKKHDMCACELCELGPWCRSTEAL